MVVVFRQHISDGIGYAPAQRTVIGSIPMQLSLTLICGFLSGYGQKDK